jgi:hypothetical protein
MPKETPMCQPSPGPRCAAHAKSTLSRARRAKADADAQYETARAGLRERRLRPIGYHVGSDTPTEETLAYQSASDARRDAAAAYEQALRDYETTPSGQRDLAEAIERLTATGELEGAAVARERLAQAAAARGQQIADLAASRVQAQRLADMSQYERNAINNGTAMEIHTSNAANHARAELAGLERLLDTHDEESAPIVAARTAASRATLAAREEVLTAQDAAVREARRVYIAAGVDQRMAGYYAQDCLDMATASDRNQPGSYSTGSEYARRSLVLKTKPSGPDRARTNAAKTASATDPAFQTANTALAEKVATHQAAMDAQQDIEFGAYRQATVRRAEIAKDVGRAEETLVAARAAHDQAVGRTARIRAQIAAGAGVRSTDVALDSVTDEIVRQPDGSINAYVYRAPSPGFPDGRYLRATGVTTVHGMGAANALLLEDGSTVHASATSSPSRRGSTLTRTVPAGVIIVPAQPGSRPLRDEAVPAAGFATFVDSSD